MLNQPQAKKWSRGCRVWIGSRGGQNKVGGRSVSAITAGYMLPNHEPALQQPPVADNISISAKMSISVIWSGRVDRIELPFSWSDSAQLQVVTRWNHPSGRLEWTPRWGHVSRAAISRVSPARIAKTGQTRLDARPAHVILCIGSRYPVYEEANNFDQNWLTQKRDPRPGPLHGFSQPLADTTVFRDHTDEQPF